MPSALLSATRNIFLHEQWTSLSNWINVNFEEEEEFFRRLTQEGTEKSKAMQNPSSIKSCISRV